MKPNLALLSGHMPKFPQQFICKKVQAATFTSINPLLPSQFVMAIEHCAAKRLPIGNGVSTTS